MIDCSAALSHVFTGLLLFHSTKLGFSCHVSEVLENSPVVRFQFLLSE